MQLDESNTYSHIRVRETEILASDTRQQYREKIARITLDSMVQFVGLLDANGTVLEINSVALNAVGINLSDVEGLPFWKTFWWQVSDEINLKLRQCIADAAQGEFVRWDTPIYGRANGKETIIIDASLAPVKDENGNVVFICAEGRDITEKKAQEREIAQKNIELQGLLERIRELDEIKTQFFANVSHELRTPLSLIIGPAERLVNESLEMNPELRKRTARLISRNAKMLLKHVNDLLDISKLQADKLRIELHETDVSELVRFVASHFEILANERRVDFHIEASSEIISAVDPGKLQRVVMNLLSNAFKFVPAGGTVNCGLVLVGKDIILTIEDSGPGIKPEMRKVIFERFRQGDGSSNRQYAGTGLGLAIANEFVELHKGTIEVLDSKLGGALFRVKIPAHQRSGLPKLVGAGQDVLDNGTLEGLLEELQVNDNGNQELLPIEPVPMNRETVLVVEDNPDMNRFIAQTLSREFQVINAFDGEEGLQKALMFKPSLILTDIMMPRVSGVQMIEQLRTRPEMQDMPIILLSAKADEELKLKLLEEHAQDFITKPFNEQELLVRVRNLVLVRKSQEAMRMLESTKRQVVEARNRELQIQSQQLSELFEQTPSFMAVLRGSNHVFELANTSFYNLVGRREIIGKAFLEALPEVNGQGFKEILDRVYASGKPFNGTGIPLHLQRERSAELEQRFVNFIFQPLFDGERKVVGVFVEGHDITDQKHAEDAVKLADKRKDEFLATLAHELRNPLAPIRHASMIGLSKDVTQPELKRAQEVIVRQVEHMGRLLDDLLDVSRITSGRFELRKEKLALNESLAAAVDIARPLIEVRGHKLEIDIPSAISYIDADPVRFEQIFSNLLTNAAKYTDPGGKISVRAETFDNKVRVTIKDNGIGISPAQLPRIFEMFSQAALSLERSEGGLGIGLALVRGLVLLHGGEIAGHSEGIGKGSEFVVTLPLSQVSNKKEKSIAPANKNFTQFNHRKRVLIVDDNRDNADLCGILFRKAGHEVRTAYSGKEALLIAGEFKPNFVLLDIGMPGMNGYEVAGRIRAADWGKDAVLLAVTGWGQEEDKRKAFAAGFNHHITKPFDASVLENILENTNN